MDGGDSNTAVGMYFMPQNCTLENKVVSFMLYIYIYIYLPQYIYIYIYHIKKKKKNADKEVKDLNQRTLMCTARSLGASKTA